MRAIGIILAGGNNHRMRELSQKRAIAALGLPVALPRHCTVPAMLEAMRRDKKNRDGAIALVLPRRIGAAEVNRDVADAEIGAALEAVHA